MFSIGKVKNLGVLDLLPAYTGKRVTIVPGEQSTHDIVTEIINAHEFFAADYNELAAFFWEGNIYDTCAKLWDFCKENISYKIESAEDQTTKSPAAIIVEGHDCKGMAGFIGGVLDAINRVYGTNIKWRYCFASYDPIDKSATHVFIVAWDSEGEIWIDPVLDRFDVRKEPTFKFYKKISMNSKAVGFAGDIEHNAPGLMAGKSIGWVQVVAALAVSVFSALNKDQVPNYPIKKSKTLDGLRKHVSLMVTGSGVWPMPTPTSFAEVNKWIANAKTALAAEQGGHGDANTTIKIIYQEVINALQQFLNQAGGLENGTTVPVIDPATGQPIPSTNTGTKTLAGMGLPMLLLGGGVVVTMLLTGKKKKSSVHGVGSNKLLLVGVAAAAAYLFINERQKKKGRLNINPLVSGVHVGGTIESARGESELVKGDGSIVPAESYDQYLLETVNFQ